MSIVNLSANNLLETNVLKISEIKFIEEHQRIVPDLSSVEYDTVKDSISKHDVSEVGIGTNGETHEASFRRASFSSVSLVTDSIANVNSNLGPKEGITQVTNPKKPRRKANSTLRCKLVQSIRNDHANLTLIKEFEIEDMKTQNRLGELT